ncbi:MAG: ABC transporter ATP-binding protein [Candidatus Thermoplasmatota archaeon]
MPKKKIKCPKCQNKMTVDLEAGQTKYVTCPECGQKGRITGSLEKKQIEDDRKSVIQVRNLTKKFNGYKATNNVSFNVKEGEIFGFLGPNGAGKTTTIKSILGLIHPDAGSIKIKGVDIFAEEKKAKKHIGYLPEKVAFYENLTALQNLNFYAEIKNISKQKSMPLIEEMGLQNAVNKKVGGFSKGMIQRLGMARAILGNPSLLILDEPTGGLDPRGVALIRNKIKELNQNGTTVFLSSHILGEVQEVCDKVGIINKGKMVAEDTVKNLSDKLNLKPKITVELEKITEKIVKRIREIQNVDKVITEGNKLDIVCSPKTKSKVIVAIEKAGGNIINLGTKETSLEEVFMKYTEEE